MRSVSYLRPNLILVLIILLAVLVYSCNYNWFPIGTHYDDAVYMVLAQSIGAGQGYNRINYPWVEPETIWPFGYPLLLSPIVTLWPFNFDAVKIFSMLLTVLALYILWRLLSERLSPPYALMVIALCALNLWIVRFATMAMSEGSLPSMVPPGALPDRQVPEATFCPMVSCSIAGPGSGVRLDDPACRRLVGPCLPSPGCPCRNLKPAIVVGVCYAIGMIPHVLVSQRAGAASSRQRPVRSSILARTGRSYRPTSKRMASTSCPRCWAWSTYGYDLSTKLGVPWLALLLTLGLLLLILIGFVATCAEVSPLQSSMWCSTAASLYRMDGINWKRPPSSAI